MSEADKMFEELGYTKSDNHPEEDEELESNRWVTQDCRIIEYEQTDIINNEIYTLYIRFHCVGQRIEIGTYKSPKEIPGMHMKLNPILDSQEISVINKKCEELGWL